MITQKTRQTKYKHKCASNPLLVLEDSEGCFGDLIKIKTTKKKETIKAIKTNLSIWMGDNNEDNKKNENNEKWKKFESFKKEKLDMAIVIFSDKLRNKRQDVDNIAKIVLDALKKSNNPNDHLYLVEDDSQIVRLLLYKLETKNMEGYETNSLIISFRKHDPNKQMILKEKETI